MQPNATPGSGGRDCAPASTFHGAPGVPAFSPSIPTVEGVVLQRRKGRRAQGRVPTFVKPAEQKVNPLAMPSAEARAGMRAGPELSLLDLQGRLRPGESPRTDERPRPWNRLARQL